MLSGASNATGTTSFRTRDASCHSTSSSHLDQAPSLVHRDVLGHRRPPFAERPDAPHGGADRTGFHDPDGEQSAGDLVAPVAGDTVGPRVTPVGDDDRPHPAGQQMRPRRQRLLVVDGIGQRTGGRVHPQLQQAVAEDAVLAGARRLDAGLAGFRHRGRWRGASSAGSPRAAP